VREPVKDGVTARLDWQAPWYSVLRLEGKGVEERFVRAPEDVTAKFDRPGDRSLQSELRLKPLLGSGPSAKVFFVRARPDTPLLVAGAGMLDDGSYSLSVPSDGKVAKLVLQNGATQSNRINYWVARRPGSAYKVLDLLAEGNINPKMLGGDQVVIKVRLARPGQQAAEDELVFVTTDAKRPLVRVRLMTEGSGGG
jgi:hypothetical protein